VVVLQATPASTPASGAGIGAAAAHWPAGGVQVKPVGQLADEVHFAEHWLVARLQMLPATLAEQSASVLQVQKLAVELLIFAQVFSPTGNRSRRTGGHARLEHGVTGLAEPQVASVWQPLPASGVGVSPQPWRTRCSLRPQATVLDCFWSFLCTLCSASEPHSGGADDSHRSTQVNRASASTYARSGPDSIADNGSCGLAPSMRTKPATARSDDQRPQNLNGKLIGSPCFLCLGNCIALMTGPDAVGDGVPLNSSETTETLVVLPLV